MGKLLKDDEVEVAQVRWGRKRKEKPIRRTVRRDHGKYPVLSMPLEALKWLGLQLGQEIELVKTEGDNIFSREIRLRRPYRESTVFELIWKTASEESAQKRRPKGTMQGKGRQQV